MTLAEYIEAKRKWVDCLVEGIDTTREWTDGYLTALSDIEDFVKTTETD